MRTVRSFASSRKMCARAWDEQADEVGRAALLLTIVTIALVAGTAIGGAVIQGLHALATPPAYVIAEIDVTNQDGYVKEYAPLAGKALGDGGAKTLARGGKTVSLEGVPPKSRISINAFESIEKAQAAFSSAAYKEARKIGDKYATFRIFVVEGEAK